MPVTSLKQMVQDCANSYRIVSGTMEGIPVEKLSASILNINAGRYAWNRYRNCIGDSMEPLSTTLFVSDEQQSFLDQIGIAKIQVTSIEDFLNDFCTDIIESKSAKQYCISIVEIKNTLLGISDGALCMHEGDFEESIDAAFSELGLNTELADFLKGNCAFHRYLTNWDHTVLYECDCMRNKLFCVPLYETKQLFERVITSNDPDEFPVQGMANGFYYKKYNYGKHAWKRYSNIKLTDSIGPKVDELMKLKIYSKIYYDSKAFQFVTREKDSISTSVENMIGNAITTDAFPYFVDGSNIYTDLRVGEMTMIGKLVTVEKGEFLDFVTSDIASDYPSNGTIDGFHFYIKIT